MLQWAPETGRLGYWILVIFSNEEAVWAFENKWLYLEGGASVLRFTVLITRSTKNGTAVVFISVHAPQQRRHITLRNFCKVLAMTWRHSSNPITLFSSRTVPFHNGEGDFYYSNFRIGFAVTSVNLLLLVYLDICFRTQWDLFVDFGSKVQ